MRNTAMENSDVRTHTHMQSNDNNNNDNQGYYN